MPSRELWRAETLHRTPAGALLCRIPHLPWAPVLSAAAAAAAQPEEAAPDLLSHFSPVYPVSRVPRSGWFTPDGAFFVDCSLDKLCSVSPSRPPEHRADPTDRADANSARQRMMKLVVRRLQERVRMRQMLQDGTVPQTGGGTYESLYSESVDDSCTISSTTSHPNEQLGNDDAELHVEIDLWAAYTKRTVDDSGATRASTRSWLKRCAAATPPSATSLVATLRRLLVDESTLVDVRIAFPFGTASIAQAEVHTIVKMTLKAAASGAMDAAGVYRRGEGQFLICTVGASTAEFVYDFCYWQLQRRRPLDSASSNLFLPGGAGERLLHTPSQLLAEVSRWDNLALEKQQPAERPTTSPIAPRSDVTDHRRRVGKPIFTCRPPLSSVPAALARVRRCSTASPVPWYVRRRPMSARTPPESTTLLSPLREHQLVVAAVTVEASVAEEDVDAEEASVVVDLTTFQLPPLPTTWASGEEECGAAERES